MAPIFLKAGGFSGFKENVAKAAGLLAHHRKDFIRGPDVRHRAAHLAIHLAALLIDHDGCAKRNILVLMAFAVQQTVFPYDLCARVTYDRDILMRNLIPDFPRMLLVIDADRNELSVHLIEIGLSLRELAQLFDAEGSPVSPIEVEHHFVAALGRESEGISLGI